LHGRWRLSEADFILELPHYERKHEQVWQSRSFVHFASLSKAEEGFKKLLKTKGRSYLDKDARFLIAVIPPHMRYSWGDNQGFTYVGFSLDTLHAKLDIPCKNLESLLLQRMNMLGSDKPMRLHHNISL